MTNAWRPDETLAPLSSEMPGARRRSLVIGVVNNMPDAAFQATTDQFTALLGRSARHDIDLTLRFFLPPDRGRIAPSANAVSGRYEPAQALWTAELDGLIVTGAEPQATRIADEPSMPFLARLVDWSEDNGLSVIWSCLAAHAAVYRLDGIERRQRDAKLSGVFECLKVQHHALLDGSPASWPMPHSRLNDLPEADLTARGYCILTRSIDVGADTFVKQVGARHLFLNGHPEYDDVTLCSEYRRDIRRFLMGQRPGYPTMPTGYFSEETVLKMAMFRQNALERPTPELMSDFPAATMSMRWRDTAISLFGNWLDGIVRNEVSRPDEIEIATIARPAAAIRSESAPFLNVIAPT